MTATSVPPGHQKLRVVKHLEHARQTFSVGAILVLDDDSANKLIKSKHVVAVELPASEGVALTACPSCGQAVDPRCGHPVPR
jgi:hypothetical protein